MPADIDGYVLVCIYTCITYIFLYVYADMECFFLLNYIDTMNSRMILSCFINKRDISLIFFLMILHEF